MSTVAVALFTSDLRVHDQPMLRAALEDARRAESGTVVPLFVEDDGVVEAGFASANRRAFLADCLRELDAGLRQRGGRLVVRRGEVVEEVCRVVRETGARRVHVAAGVTRYAARRERRLADELASQGAELRVHDGVVTALPAGWVTPQGRDHFAVFTPYYRRWADAGPRTTLGAPRRVPVPGHIGGAALPRRSSVSGVSPQLAAGGEQTARRRLTEWLDGPVRTYGTLHDDLAADGTSRLSPFLHFGCVSAVEVVARARKVGGEGAQALVRQVAWRDFHHQVLAARPGAAEHDYRTHHDRWRDAPEEARAWREGRTGYPIIDAGMRQLRAEGWMHNRARLLTAGFLTKTLYVDWRVGARHFLDLLVDGDIANNQMNWQWVAGTGTDTRPNRVLNPLTQAKRFDPQGSYVRRWVPELADVGGGAVHRPGQVQGYPAPVTDAAAGRDRFLAARGK